MLRSLVGSEMCIRDSVKGFHVYKALWTPEVGETLRSEGEPDNPIDKYAVCIKKENKIVGHLPLGKSGKFAKTIFYFLRADKLSSCKITVTGKPVNQRVLYQDPQEASLIHHSY